MVFSATWNRKVIRPAWQACIGVCNGRAVRLRSRNCLVPRISRHENIAVAIHCDVGIGLVVQLRIVTVGPKRHAALGVAEAGQSSSKLPVMTAATPNGRTKCFEACG